MLKRKTSFIACAMMKPFILSTNYDSNAKFKKPVFALNRRNNNEDVF